MNHNHTLMVERDNQQDSRTTSSVTDRRSLLKMTGAGVAGTLLTGCLSDDGGNGNGNGLGDAPGSGNGGMTTTIEGADVDVSAWQEADINWRKYEGQDLVLALLRHPFVSNLEPLLPAFEELTGMDLNVVQYPEQEYRQKRLTDLSTGAGVFDAIMLGQPLMQYQEAGWLEPLGQYLDDDELFDPEWFNMDDIVSAAMSIARGRDQLDQPVAMPATTEATLVFYRKDRYEEQGLDVPTTFEEYRQNVQTLDENYEDPGIVARGQKGYGMNLYPFSGYLRSHGADHWADYPNESGLDTEAAYEAADYYSSILQDFGPENPSSYTWSDCLNQMSSGNASHWGADTSYFYESLSNPDSSDIPDQIGIAPHPEGPNGVQPNTFSWLMAASQESARPGAAWLFMVFATSEPAQRYLAVEQGFPPVRNSLYSELEGSEYTEVVLPMMEEAQPSQWDPRFPEWGQQVSTRLQSIVAGDLSPEEGMNRAAADMESVYSE